MRPGLSYGFAAFAASVLMLVSCNGNKIIPPAQMSQIFEEMYMADQWVRETTRRQRMADTVNVYLPIFRKYGYTADDFRRSLDFYTDTPGKMADIYGNAGEALSRRKKEVELRERGKFVSDSLARARALLPYRHADFATVNVPEFYVGGMLMTQDTSGLWRFNPISVGGEDTLIVLEPAALKEALKVSELKSDEAVVLRSEFMDVPETEAIDEEAFFESE